MNEEKAFLNIFKMAKEFTKIAQGINPLQLEELDKELLKIYPSDESEVLLITDYSESDNSVGLSIYVTKPVAEEEVGQLAFDELLFEYLVHADIDRLPKVYRCLEMMDKKGGDTYEVDFIPVFYTEEINSYDIHIRITKKIE